jgi:hypothetical protein
LSTICAGADAAHLQLDVVAETELRQSMVDEVEGRGAELDVLTLGDLEIVGPGRVSAPNAALR